MICNFIEMVFLSKLATLDVPLKVLWGNFDWLFGPSLSFQISSIYLFFSSPAALGVSTYNLLILRLGAVNTVLRMHNILNVVGRTCKSLSFCDYVSC